LTDFVNSRKDHDVVFTFRDITVPKVISIRKRICPNKSAGIDKKNVRLLRLAAPVIAPSIVRIINYSFASGTFPQRWKTAKVTPLFKKGDASDPSNYHPISVLTVLSKFIKRYVHNSLYDFLQVNNLIYS